MKPLHNTPPYIFKIAAVMMIGGGEGQVRGEGGGGRGGAD